MALHEALNTCVQETSVTAFSPFLKGTSDPSGTALILSGNRPSCFSRMYIQPRRREEEKMDCRESLELTYIICGLAIFVGKRSYLLQATHCGTFAKYFREVFLMWHFLIYGNCYLGNTKEPPKVVVLQPMVTCSLSCSVLLPQDKSYPGGVVLHITSALHTPVHVKRPPVGVRCSYLLHALVWRLVSYRHSWTALVPSVLHTLQQPLQFSPLSPPDPPAIADGREYRTCKPMITSLYQEAGS